MMINFINKLCEEYKNTSKKLILVRIISIILMIVVLILVFLFIKNTSKVIDIKDSKRHSVATKSYAIRNDKKHIVTISNIDKKIKKQKIKVDNKKKKEIETDNSTPHIFKYIEFVKEKIKVNSKSNNSYFIKSNDTNNSENKVINRAIYNDSARHIQSLYDNKGYEKDSWLLIDEDMDGYGYNYYFDNRGILLIDTLTPDYRYVNIDGKEVDNELNPIIYEVKHNAISTMSSVQKVYVPVQVIYSPGTSRKEKSKVYDNEMSRDINLYISDSLRFKKRTNGTIFDGAKWKQVSSIKDDGGYVIYENPQNNFNKVVGKIALQETSKDEYKDIGCTLYVYDADIPYLNERYDVDPIYEISVRDSIVNFSFTFHRSVKRLKFLVICDSDEYKPLCYIKDVRYGFNNIAYKEELEEAEEEETYKKLMKELGIYIEDEDEYKTYLSENIEDDYYEYEDWNDTDLYDDEYIESLNNEIDRDYDKEQARIDRVTGPAFDEILKKAIDFWFTGPAFDEKFNNK